MTQAPYGAWQSPISADMIVSDSVGIGTPCWFAEGLVWLESRPQEGGRNVLVYRDANGTESDVNPAPFNVRTRVHEYGGSAWLATPSHLYFVNFADQQVYQQAVGETTPTQLTDVPSARFANGCLDTDHNRLIYVMEDHSGDSEARNMIAAVALDSGAVTILASGHDFYSSPVVSPDGTRLVYLTWDHPDMPWDETTLWSSTISADGSLAAPVIIAGGQGSEQAVQQPRFSPDGVLHYVNDTSGWWNLYSEAQDASLCPMAAEFGGPHWGFGLKNYDFLDANEIVCIYGIGNEQQLGTLKNGLLTTLDTPYSAFSGFSLQGRTLATVVASPLHHGESVLIDLDAPNAISTVKQTTAIDLDDSHYSVPETISYPSADHSTAHAFFYPPKNPAFSAPANDRPPLIVIFHGGPTGATHNTLSLRTQFWTSRGFAVLDVNYRGSTGYGREYRNALRGGWGVVDVEDAKAGAEYLVREDRVNGQHLAIRGGSAGGYTTLCALTNTDTFQAGASYYGVSDLEALARDTHKFESRYLDSMVGPYPEQAELYQQRSPISHTDRLQAACIFFQGLEDKVVPPNQAEMMVSALRQRGKPVAYVTFEGEQHGFRQAANIKRSLELELYFYGRVFGFEPADVIAGVPIDNLD